MISIKLGKQNINLEQTITLQDFLAAHGQIQETFAVAVNSEFVPKQNYSQILLQHEDRVDIIMPMQGG